VEAAGWREGLGVEFDAMGQVRFVVDDHYCGAGGERGPAGVAGGGERGEGVVVEVGEFLRRVRAGVLTDVGAPRLLKKNGMSMERPARIYGAAVDSQPNS
jgi:hypothetical protein